MTSDPDIYRAAKLLIDQHGEDGSELLDAKTEMTMRLHHPIHVAPLTIGAEVVYCLDHAVLKALSYIADADVVPCDQPA